MLQRIRDNASGPLAYAVVALITVVFGVWGIGSYFTDSPNPVVATVGGAEITKYELDREYDMRYQRLQRLMGENFDHELIKPQSFKREVLQGLIEREMLNQFAREEGFRTPDSRLLKELADDRRFQVDGKFAPDRYTAMLSQARISPAQYEAGIRGDLQLEQVRGSVLESAFVAPPEARLQYRLENQRRQVAYLHFDPEAYVDDIELADDQIEQYFAEHRGQYMQPERARLAYIELDRNALEDAEKPDEEYLRALYEQEKDTRFASPERRRARHILVRIDEDSDADAAREEILALKQQLDAGADFADLARRESDDQTTAEKGGTLDWVTRGSMVPAFEEKLFGMEEGAVSQPVKTDFGWHIISLQEIDPSTVKPFSGEDVQTELLDLYQSQERDERYRQLAEKLDSLSFEAPNSLQPISDELGLEIKETGWITRSSNAEGLGRYDAVRRAAFSDSVLKDGLNSTPVQLGGERQVVLRVKEHQQARQQSLEDVRESVRADLRAEQAAEQAQAAAEQALERIKGGQTVLEAGQDTRADVKEAEWVTRSSDSVPAAVLSGAFGLPESAADSPDGVTLADMGARGESVVKLLAVEEAEPDEVLSNNPTLVEGLRSRRAGSEYAAFMAYLRNNFEVEIMEDRVN